MKRKKISFKVKYLLCFIFVFVLLSPKIANAASITLDTTGDGGNFGPLDILLLMSILTLAPFLLIMMTSFTRIIIVMSFVRNAIGMPQSPPNQVLLGLSLFLTLFVMTPVINKINDQAYQPYSKGEITQEEAIDRGVKPLKEFMLKQTYKKDLAVFLSISGTKINENASTEQKIQELNLSVVVPAFVSSELKRAFIMGFLIFIPFLIIDMVVASTLMSMGMVMLPPGTIALPFKILLFILVDGWSLLFSTLSQSFRL